MSVSHTNLVKKETIGPFLKALNSLTSPVSEKIQSSFEQLFKHHPTYKKWIENSFCNQPGMIRDAKLLSEMIHQCKWETFIPYPNKKIKKDLPQISDHNMFTHLLATALKMDLISLDQFMTHNSLVAAHQATVVNPSQKVVISDQVIERKASTVIQELIRSNKAFYLKPSSLFQADGTPQEKELKKITYYFGLDDEEIKKFVFLMSDSNIPQSEKTIFTSQVAYGLNEFSPELATLSRRFKRDNTRLMRTHKNKEFDLFKYTLLIVPSNTMYKIVQKIRNPAAEFDYSTLTYLSFVDEKSNHYSKILISRLKSMQEAYNAVKKVSTHPMLPSAYELFMGFLKGLMPVEEKAVPKIPPSLLPKPVNWNDYELLMRYRPKHVTQLFFRKGVGEVQRIAKAINESRWDLILPQAGDPTWDEERLKELIDNLLVALKERLITIEQFTTINSVLAVFYGLILNPTELTVLNLESKPWPLKKIDKITAPQGVRFNYGYKERNAFVVVGERLDQVCLNHLRSNPAYFPHAAKLIAKDGKPDPTVVSDLAHYYGLNDEDLKKLLERLEKESDSEKVIFRARVPSGLSEFSPLIWAQTHKLTIPTSDNPELVKKVFRPFRNHTDGEYKITELLIPSTTIHNLAMRTWNNYPHQVVPVMVPEEDSLLPEKLFDVMHKHLRRPVQLFYPGGNPLNHIDGRYVKYDFHAFLHDQWHVLQDTLTSIEGHSVRDLFAESLQHIKNSIPKTRLIDGEILYPTFSFEEVFIFNKIASWFEKDVQKIEGWDDNHTQAIARGMVTQENLWKKKFGKTWKDLPRESVLFKKCATDYWTLT